MMETKLDMWGLKPTSTELSPDGTYTIQLSPLIPNEVYLLLFNYHYGVDLKGVFNSKQLAEDAKRDLVYKKYLPTLANERRKSKIFWEDWYKKEMERIGKYGYPVRIPADGIGEKTDEELEKMANDAFEILAVRLNNVYDGSENGITLYCE